MCHYLKEQHVSFSLARFNVRLAICHHERGRGGSAAPSSAGAARTDGKNIDGFAAQNLSKRLLDPPWCQRGSVRAGPADSFGDDREIRFAFLFCFRFNSNHG